MARFPRLPPIDQDSGRKAEHDLRMGWRGFPLLQSRSLPLASFPSECYANGGAALTEELPLATVALANANPFHVAQRNAISNRPREKC